MSRSHWSASTKIEAMPRAKSVNTLRCRKLDMIDVLRRSYALSLLELARRMKMSPRSIRRYLHELEKDRRVFKHYTWPKAGAKKPIYYYSLSRRK